MLFDKFFWVKSQARLFFANLQGHLHVCELRKALHEHQQISFELKMTWASKTKLVHFVDAMTSQISFRIEKERFLLIAGGQCTGFSQLHTDDKSHSQQKIIPTACNALLFLSFEWPCPAPSRSAGAAGRQLLGTAQPAVESSGLADFAPRRPRRAIAALTSCTRSAAAESAAAD